MHSGSRLGCVDARSYHRGIIIFVLAFLYVSIISTSLFDVVFQNLIRPLCVGINAFLCDYCKQNLNKIPLVVSSTNYYSQSMS